MREIRVLSLAEVELLLGWAAHEGWNPGLGDAPAFHAADPDGFLGAFVGSTMVAAIAAVAYDAHFGFIGLYICHPDWRGQGHGKAVWDAGMRHLGTRTIGLDGVPEQQANYASMGFVGAYETVRMSGSMPSRMSPEIVALDASNLPAIREMDRRGFPAAREGFLEHWVAPPNRALAVVRDGSPVGYAVVRHCVEGHKVGPLFAEDGAAAAVLLEAAGVAIQIDVPAYQTGLLARLAEFGFTPGFVTARMYRGPAPELERARVFGITSLELG